MSTSAKTPISKFIFTWRSKTGMIKTVEAPTREALIDRVFVESGWNYNYVFNKVTKELNKQAQGKSPMPTRSRAPGTGACSNGKRLTLFDAINGAKAVLKNIGGDVESNTVIAARSAVCKMCPELAKASDCMTCKAGVALTNGVNYFKRLVGGKSTPNIPADLKSKFCCVCGCSSMVILSSRVENFNDVASRPVHCWVVTETAAKKAALAPLAE